MRSYDVITEDRAQYRGNWKHLRKTKEDDISIKPRGLQANATHALPVTPPPRKPAMATPIRPSAEATGHTDPSGRTMTPHSKEPAVATPGDPFSEATGCKIALILTGLCHRTLIEHWTLIEHCSLILTIADWFLVPKPINRDFFDFIFFIFFYKRKDVTIGIVL